MTARLDERRLAQAIDELARFVVGLRWSDVPSHVRDRLELVLLDHLVVTIAGTGTAEGRRLVAATRPGPGPAPVVGAGIRAVEDAAAWLNGTACCMLELDEGNKYARGHPAAHVFPAAMAHAATVGSSGTDLAAALLAGYEVAARAGAATHLHAGVHPHGNWGALGAAAAVCRLEGDPPRQVAATLDAAGGMMLATPFATVLAGNQVRNTWVGHANLAGLQARRFAAAGLAGGGATVGATLGGLLGSLDVAALDHGLGEDFLVTRGYFKRHASCSYTHPPADAVLALRRERPGLVADDIDWVRVETHHLAVGLAGTEVPTRLAAMFSIPHVVAVALANGDCTPRRFDAAHRDDPTLARLRAAVTVARTDALDARLPAERAARVVIGLRDGAELVAEVPNPVGDVDHHPFGYREVCAKAVALLDPLGIDVADVATVAAQLLSAPDVRPVLQELP